MLDEANNSCPCVGDEPSRHNKYIDVIASLLLMSNLWQGMMLNISVCSRSDQRDPTERRPVPTWRLQRPGRLRPQLMAAMHRTLRSGQA